MYRRAASDQSQSQTLPSIAACFLIRFDQRIGYTIAWKRSLYNLEVDGAVEYNSLPSGLHNVKEDLVYFKHEQYAGLSAFQQEPATETERNAQFVAVGILFPLRHGRFGRGWLHAAHLKELAAILLQDITNTKPLEDYWEMHQDWGTRDSADNDEAGVLLDSITDASLNPDPLSYHPILSFSKFLDDFGPLVFPIYRAALLRQRILFIKKPPMRICCEYVYILSVISSIPPVLVESLPDHAKASALPLFTICIHDIPMLEGVAAGTRDAGLASIASTGWIACSSDEVLSTKPTLSDMIISIPSGICQTAGKRQWPSIQDNKRNAGRATQRDARRYDALRQGIRQLEAQRNDLNNITSQEPGNDSSSSLPRTREQSLDVDVSSDPAVVEPQSWAAVAYDSYMWWASAGERNTDLQEEFDQDADLLFIAADVWEDVEVYKRRHKVSTVRSTSLEPSGALEMALVAYFHRLTIAVMETLLRVIEASDAAHNGEPDNEGRIFVSKDDMVCMGLDPWSASDRVWVARMSDSYFGREAEVEGGSVECCGVKFY